MREWRGPATLRGMDLVRMTGVASRTHVLALKHGTKAEASSEEVRVHFGPYGKYMCLRC